MKYFMIWILTFCISITTSPVFASNQTEEALRKVSIDMQRNTFEKRLKRAKTEDEYLAIQNEAFKSGSRDLTSALAKISDSKIESLWTNIDENMKLSQIEGLEVIGETARDKINYLASQEFQAKITTYVKKEIKNAGGFERFKQSLASLSSDCLSKDHSKCSTNQRKISSVGSEEFRSGVTEAFSIIGTVIFCIVLIPLCIFAYMMGHA